ncbi:MAG: PGF-CTERM sorting domain-containing protein [Candidatus Thermoplasmatota archaeon]
MRLKIQKMIIICIILFALSTTFLVKDVEAEKPNYSISIENINEKQIKKEGSILFYKITVTLKNKGSELSENLTVVITDDYDFKTRTPAEEEKQIKLQPGETHDFVFGENEEWMIDGDRPHELTIKVLPNNNESRTPLCTQTYMLNKQKQEDSLIPGFEMIAAIIGITIVVYYFKRNQKK